MKPTDHTNNPTNTWVATSTNPAPPHDTTTPKTNPQLQTKHTTHSTMTSQTIRTNKETEDHPLSSRACLPHGVTLLSFAPGRLHLDDAISRTIFELLGFFFFWQSGGHKKIGFTNWNIIFRPRDRGGLGVEVLD